MSVKVVLGGHASGVFLVTRVSHEFGGAFLGVSCLLLSGVGVLYFYMYIVCMSIYIVEAGNSNKS